jgi:dual specificity phosphatase 12
MEEMSAPSDVVLVHCDRGISRSSAIVIAYLMRKYKWPLERMLEMVKVKRTIRLSSTFMKQLQVWEKIEFDIWEDSKKEIPKAYYRAYLDERAVILKSKGLTGHESIALVNL